MSLEVPDELMYIKSSGEIKVRSGINKLIENEICNSTKCDCIEKARKLIKKKSRTKLTVGTTKYADIISMPASIVRHWAKCIGLDSLPGLDSNLDLEAGKYEGGFKVWESTADLVKFISEDMAMFAESFSTKGRLRILELGAGASLPSLALIKHFSHDNRHNLIYRIHVQDYNWQVLASSTILNFAFNLSEDEFTSMLDNKSLRFFSGDWANFRSDSRKRYHLIMMSEVLYNYDNYESLHNLLANHLKQDGYIVIATKDTYFGLSGGLFSWLEFIDMKQVFTSEKILKVSLTNIPRSILIMRRR